MKQRQKRRLLHQNKGKEEEENQTLLHPEETHARRSPSRSPLIRGDCGQSKSTRARETTKTTCTRELILFWVVLIFLIFGISASTTWLRNRMLRVDRDLEGKETVEIPQSLESSLFAIVTASGPQDFDTLVGGLVWSLSQPEFQDHCTDCLFIVYDLGLTVKQRRQLRTYKKLTLRTFMKDRLPKVFQKKPLFRAIIIEEVLNQFEKILWIDPIFGIKSTISEKGLQGIRLEMENDGLIALQSEVQVSDEISETAEKLGGHISDVFDKKMCDTSIIGVDRKVPGVHELVDAWRNCAVDEECGAVSYPNSKYTQSGAIFSLLILLPNKLILRSKRQEKKALKCAFQNTYFEKLPDLFQIRSQELYRQYQRRTEKSHGRILG